MSTQKLPLLVLSLLLSPLFPLSEAQAQVSVDVGIALPGLSIGLNLPAYPRMVRVPGYPVYYNPSGSDNYFFYDGLYWVYRDDNWYQSSWYNGPWAMQAPEVVPLFVLRVPVRYYRRPPVYFRGWAVTAAPRWGEHWGSSWEARRPGWNTWNRRIVPVAAPLPNYQRAYAGARYPQQVTEQKTILVNKYRYQPREAVAQQHLRQVAVTRPSAQNAHEAERAQPAPATTAAHETQQIRQETRQENRTGEQAQRQAQKSNAQEVRRENKKDER